MQLYFTKRSTSKWILEVLLRSEYWTREPFVFPLTKRGICLGLTTLSAIKGELAKKSDIQCRQTRARQ